MRPSRTWMNGSSRLRLATSIVAVSSRFRLTLSVARVRESRRLSSVARSAGLCARRVAASARTDSGRSEGRTPGMVVAFIIPRPPWVFRGVCLPNRLAHRNFCALGAPLSVTACAYCGRDNEAGAQFCMDCGKPLGNSTGIKAAAAVWSTRAVAAPGAAAHPRDARACPFCGARTSATLPFCAQCGRRLTAPGSGPSCARCASPVAPDARFCPTCGATLGETPPPPPPSPPPALVRTSSAPRRTGGTIALALLDEAGTVTERFDGRGPELTIGRQAGDIRFPDDLFLSPL